MFRDITKTRLARWLSSGLNFERRDHLKRFEDAILEISPLNYREDIATEFQFHRAGAETFEEDVFELSIEYFSDFDGYPNELVRFLNRMLEFRYHSVDMRTWKYLLDEVGIQEFLDEGIVVQPNVIGFSVRNSVDGVLNENQSDSEKETDIVTPPDSTDTAATPNSVIHDKNTPDNSTQASHTEIELEQKKESNRYTGAIILVGVLIIIVILIMVGVIIQTQDYGLIVTLGAGLIALLSFFLGLLSQSRTSE